MRLQRTLRIGATVIACAALPVAGCSTNEFGTGPNGGAGQLTVDVTAVGAPGAAFEVMVIGDGITNPVVASAGDLLYSFSSNDTLKVAVIGEHSSGPLFKFSVPDVGQADSYTIRLLGVAGSDNAMLARSDFSLAASN
jgi:hypothetical protein